MLVMLAMEMVMVDVCCCCHLVETLELPLSSRARKGRVGTLLCVLLEKVSNTKFNKSMIPHFFLRALPASPFRRENEGHDCSQYRCSTHARMCRPRPRPPSSSRPLLSAFMPLCGSFFVVVIATNPTVQWFRNREGGHFFDEDPKRLEYLAHVPEWMDQREAQKVDEPCVHYCTGKVACFVCASNEDKFFCVSVVGDWELALCVW